jgi:hypothetical protein
MLRSTSVVDGSSLVADDSAEALRLPGEMAEKQYKTFEQVFSAKPQVQKTVDAVARLVETREALAIKRLVVSRKK